MVSQSFPVRGATPMPAFFGTAAADPAGGRELLACQVAPGSSVAWVPPVWSGHEPLRGQLRDAARRQGPRVDSGTVPVGSRARQFRWSLLLSDAQTNCDRRWRQCVAGRDRQTDRTVPVL